MIQLSNTHPSSIILPSLTIVLVIIFELTDTLDFLAIKVLY